VLWYPTQAKVRLEWGTQLFLQVEETAGLGGCDFITFSRSHRLLNGFVISTGAKRSGGTCCFFHLQQKLGAPFKPYFGLSGIPQHSTHPLSGWCFHGNWLGAEGVTYGPDGQFLVVLRCGLI
jgi:hypothetical protein